MLGVFKYTNSRKQDQRRTELRRALLRYQARIGGEIFGPAPAGVRREFFCLDPYTWVWHEEWKDEQGKQRVLTTRYDVRPSGVVKSQGDNIYQALSEQELDNFLAAALLYNQQVGTELRRLLQTAA